MILENGVKRLFDYKIKALNEILLNDNIIKALRDTTPEFLDNVESELLENRDDLIYSQVFPFLAVTSNFTETKSYITLSCIFESDSRNLGTCEINIYVFAHYNIVRTENGERQGFIANEINNLMLNTNGFGIGEIYKNTIREFQLDTTKDYIGVHLKYYIKEFR